MSGSSDLCPGAGSCPRVGLPSCFILFTCLKLMGPQQQLFTEVVEGGTPSEKATHGGPTVSFCIFFVKM